MFVSTSPKRTRLDRYTRQDGDRVLYRKWRSDPIAQLFWRSYRDVPYHYKTPKYQESYRGSQYSYHRRNLKRQWQRCCWILAVEDPIYWVLPFIKRHLRQAWEIIVVFAALIIFLACFGTVHR